MAEKLKTAAQVHQLFYSGLGKLIEDTRRGGPTEFIILGDFNATVLRGIHTKIRPKDKQLTDWCNLHGLVIVELKGG